MKYLDPRRYVKRLKLGLLKVRLKLIRPVRLTIAALGESVTFAITTQKEYFYRYKASYEAEKTTMYWIGNLMRKDDTVWDIGANVGAYSMLIGKRLKRLGGGKVFAFEPESGNFYALNRNIHLNNLGDIVLPVPIAFGGGDGPYLGEFYLSSNEIGSATHALDRPESDGIVFEPTHRQGIISMGVDDFVKLPGVDFPNHIKIDVDGFEQFVISKMEKALFDRRLRTVVIEVAVALSEGKIESSILAAGFKLEQIERWNTAGGEIENQLWIKC